MRGQPRYTDKEILETLSPAELDSIHGRVARSVAFIWDASLHALGHKASENAETANLENKSLNISDLYRVVT